MAGGRTAAERYEELGLADALSRPYDYSSACHELSLILRVAYAKLPKNLQSLVFGDVLSAFRVLPVVQTNCGITSANGLVQAAEASLPRQKKLLAISEFKHAVVAHKRGCKALQNVGLVQLPQDVLLHIFSFLDMRSLINVSSVSWAWNSAASDNMLWRSQFSLYFGENEINFKSEWQNDKILTDEKDVSLPQEGLKQMSDMDWRAAFKRKYTGGSAWRLASHRAICGYCKSIIWLSRMTCAAPHSCLKLGYHKSKLKSISPYKVVEYLLGDVDLTTSSSDSEDSDSDGSSLFSQHLPKLWAYPRLTSSKRNPTGI